MCVWLDFSFFDIVVKTERTFWSVWWMKICILISTRNYIEIIIRIIRITYYIQETVWKRERETFKSFLLKKDKLGQVQMFQGQIINDKNNSKGSTQEKTKTYHPQSLFHFNYNLSPNRSLLKKLLIFMIYNDFMWFIPCSLLFEGNFSE